MSVCILGGNLPGSEENIRWQPTSQRLVKIIYLSFLLEFKWHKDYAKDLESWVVPSEGKKPSLKF